MKGELFPMLALLLVAAGTPAAASASAPAEAKFLFRSSGKDLIVQSGFRSHDGCLVTEAGVIAWEYNIRSQDRNVDDAEAQVFLTVTDTCEGEVVFKGFGMAQESTDTMDLNISPSLDAARLVADVPFTDDSSAKWIARVDVTFQATDDPVQRTFFLKDQLIDSCKVRIRYSSTEATATAAGSLVITGTEYTPEPAEWAWIADVRRVEFCR
jgi:hypothetical protein